MTDTGKELAPSTKLVCLAFFQFNSMASNSHFTTYHGEESIKWGFLKALGQGIPYYVHVWGHLIYKFNASMNYSI